MHPHVHIAMQMLANARKLAANAEISMYGTVFTQIIYKTQQLKVVRIVRTLIKYAKPTIIQLSMYI